MHQCWLTPLERSHRGVSGFTFKLTSATHLSSLIDEKSVNIRSFHSSVLILEHSPSAERLHIPPCCVWTQKNIGKRGPPSQVRWAESGGWHDASWNDLPLDVWPIDFSGMADVHSFFSYWLLACSGYMSGLGTYLSSTAIGLWKHRIPSDLRS